MDNSPKVSILLPVYNVEKYIGRCIRSILCQSFRNFELIVVDDASPDSSMDIVNEYALGDSRIRIIRKERNEGLMSARRAGYLNAKGDYIVFCDSDDFLPVNSIEILYNSIVDTSFDVVFANYVRKDRFGEHFFERAVGTYNTPNDILLGLVRKKFSTYLWGCIFNKRIFEYEYQFLEKQTINEDFILLTQILERSINIHLINESVYVYVINSNSSTGSAYSKDRFMQELKAMHWLLKSPLSERYYNEVQQNLIRRMSILLELGFSFKEITYRYPSFKKIYAFPNRRKYYPLYYCIFTSLLVSSSLFCRVAFKMRRFIRYILKR